ncbi:MAG: hypothetical protein KGL46_06715 [Hyphomicrobiales bacterium]|nr:hypothetical protein [Hyphomicrobiales bacterium]
MHNPFPGRLAQFARIEDGSIGVIAALTIAPLLVMGGVAMDFARVNDARARLQSALDSAALAGAGSASNQAATASTVFANAMRQTGLQTLGTPSFRTDSTGAFVASAQASVAMPFAAIVGYSSTTVGAQAQALRTQNYTPQTLSFAISGATGWYWKQVDLYVHTAGDAGDTLMASFIYQPVNLNLATGATSALFRNSAGQMVAGAVTQTIALNSGFDKIYMKMSVYSDGCGPGMAPTTPMQGSTTSYKCVASGTTVNRTTYTKTTQPTIYATNDPNTAQNLFIGLVEGTSNVGKTQLAPGKVPSIFTLMPCGGGASNNVQYAWEDTPPGSPGVGSWAQQDFIFNVALTCSTGNANFQNVKLKN